MLHYDTRVATASDTVCECLVLLSNLDSLESRYMYMLYYSIDTLYRRTLWKSSNWTPATAPLILEAMALQASPTKSGTEKILNDSFSLTLSGTSKCLEYAGNIMDRQGMRVMGRVGKQASITRAQSSH